MTLTPRQTQWLYVHESLPVRVSGVSSGLVLTASLCSVREGAPAAIGTLSGALAETSPGEHSLDFSRSALLSQLTAADRIGKKVYLHLDDGVHRRDVWPFLVTDVDPDLLGDCPQT